MTSLRFHNVSVAGHNGPRLHVLDLELKTGDCVALLGPNGAGKSTLLRAALGLERLAGGTVALDAVAVARLTPKQRAARMAWLPQQASVHEAVSCRELVASARYRFDESQRTSLERADAALERVGLSRHAVRSALELSGGEFQRLQVAALLSQEAPLLLLDEPATHLDPLQQHELYVLLGELWREGRGLLLVTHDVNLLGALGAPSRVRVVGLRSGELVFERSFDDTHLRDDLARLFGVPMLRLTGEGGVWLLPCIASGEPVSGEPESGEPE